MPEGAEKCRRVLTTGKEIGVRVPQKRVSQYACRCRVIESRDRGKCRFENGNFSMMGLG